MLAGTAARHVLTRPTLQTALGKVRAETLQIAAGHLIWDTAARLYPEISDELLRAEFTDLEYLPAWAGIDRNPDSEAA